MIQKNLQDSFTEFCKENNFEVNTQQKKIVNQIDQFFKSKKTIFNYLIKPKQKLCFYLSGNIGVGKTMLLNFFYDRVETKKKIRLHFNEFMISFHNFNHKKKNINSIKSFVKNLKDKYNLIYLDEFQVTNIVDAMILGKLFEIIFSKNIKIIITTNIKLDDLYKDGLQREKFLPFISIIRENSIQEELILGADYRLLSKDKFKRIFYPLNEKTSFKINKVFRELSRNNLKEKKIITTKGRNFTITNFYSGIIKLYFNELCDNYLGAEDYINIAAVCKHLFIEKVPIFTDTNSNQQLRFITLIDIFYEKKIPLTLSLENNLLKLGSSKKHKELFKRTLSRLNEMTGDFK